MSPTHCLNACVLAVALLIGSLVTARADDTACNRIDAANRIAGARSQEHVSGFAFDRYTPEIFGPGTRTCGFAREESVDGEPASVYAERYVPKAETTDAQIRVSKTAGRLLREETDGDIPGKGKSHDLMHFTCSKNSQRKPFRRTS